MADLRLGQGDEYEIKAVDRVVTDPKILEWRRQGFYLLGFAHEEAVRLSVMADVHLRDVEKWLSQGATHTAVLSIVRPL